MPLNINSPPPDRPLPSLPPFMDNDAESITSAAEIRDIPLYRPRPLITSPKNHSFDRPRTSSRPEIRTLIAQSQPPAVYVPTRVSSRQSSRKFEAVEPKEPLPTMPLSDHASTIDSRPRSRQSQNDSVKSFQTNATSLPSLPPLQQKGLDEHDQLEPLNEEDIDLGSFDLVAPLEDRHKQYSLETRSELLFSTEHLKIIFGDPSLLLQFTSFLSTHRAVSVPILIYYLDAIKALKAISYSNAIAEALEPIEGFDFTAKTPASTINGDLQQKAKQAFDVMVREGLPAYITFAYIQTVSLSIQRRITGTLPSHLREASEGLAEVFCLTDPSRPDNPIVFASEEFHRTTQYGMSYVLGRNCRFLQGPKTSPHSVRRLRDAIDAGREHCEVFLNYRRDGSPFMNLLMMAPLCDSRGTIRYFIGAQVDVSGLVKDCADLESLSRLVGQVENDVDKEVQEEDDPPPKDEFQELSEMLNLRELDTVRRWGGRMHKESHQEVADTNYKTGNWNKPRLLINNSPDGSKNFNELSRGSGRLSGIYENYLLVRPYPSLRILFSSPSLRVPGILQSPFMAKIGGSSRVRDELSQALADGRGVTAKVRWVSKTDTEGRNRWIHCTPLLGSNGAIGVWMIVIVDDETSTAPGRRFKMAPPVDPKFGRSVAASTRDDGSLRDFAIMNGSKDREGSIKKGEPSIISHTSDPDRSASPYNLRNE
ncbi:hypothetical protein G7Y89_g5779 [Cudoniella acicularis]|uniref:PAC domain-containing protein n=1 Tax=Cudoniella acicularis TaxID=354080 RepID=A0A8H4RNG3_9HELO|nr:hypothetical protein G7Y89_g5779 [Cudoniella acicularis]